MRRLMVASLVCLSGLVLLLAQVPPPRLIVTPASHLYVVVNGPDLAAVQACRWKAYLDGASLGIVVPAVTCALAPAPSRQFLCTLPPMATAFPALTAGFHAVMFTQTPPPPNDLESLKAPALAFTYQTIEITTVGVK